ncbi:hypothetical protein EV421DRAFT_1892151 [Armillaria borealis]|uniref:ACT domain-containing protein n=1 Tax=Armillaria borealis TaxID=47425 RepID=A0AA39JB84_9AGAR|nr:hypothetical protein EV421DRAFT_1892151 [Armillaria borealis]
MASLLCLRVTARSATHSTSRTLSTRFISSSTTARADDEAPMKPPQPPKPIDDSTSALDYKRTQRIRPPPLPAMDLPRSRTAEEAVTNILYNTPPPSIFLNCLVQNEPGVLSRVSGILAGRGFNIDSLVVCSTEIPDLSRMCIVLKGQDGVVEQARRQLEDLITPIRVPSNAELVLVKVSILGPEYLDEQLVGGNARMGTEHPSKLEQETVLAHNFERGIHPEAATSLPLTPSQALRQKAPASSLDFLHWPPSSAQRSSTLALIVSLSSSQQRRNRVEAFLKLIKPFGVLEAARTGLMAMPRTPIDNASEDEMTESTSHAVDASLLPPG